MSRYGLTYLFLACYSTLQIVIVRLLQKVLGSVACLAILADSSVIQLAAWASMLPTRVVELGSVEEAVESTFSGKEPCALCKLAAKAQEEERQEEKRQVKHSNLPKIIPSTDSSAALVFRIPETRSFQRKLWDEVYLGRADCPDTPPPESMFV